jgi:hypothetical protein
MIRQRSPLAALAVLAALALTALACQSVANFFSRPESAAPAPTDAVGFVAATNPPSAGEATPTPRRLELPPTPTPFTVGEDDPRAQLDLGHPDHNDSFDNPVTWFDFDTPGRAAYVVEDGQLLGKDYEPDEIYAWWSYTDTSSGNLYTEISATNGDCIGKDSVGLAMRVDRDTAAGGYSLEVSCDGAWRFRLHQIGGDQVEFVDWTPSEAVAQGPGATNRLGIWGYQARFTLFVNGVEVGQYWDTHYRHSYGTFAAYVRASQTYDLTATFDDFAYWNINFVP